MGRLVRCLVGVLAPMSLVLGSACAGSFTGSSASGGSSWSSGGSSSRATSSTGAAPTGAVSAVSCSGARCSVTLGGDGARAHVLGTTIAFRGITAGRATLRVGGKDVTLVRGGEVTAGTLRLTCTDVVRDTVSLTAVRG